MPQAGKAEKKGKAGETNSFRTAGKRVTRNGWPRSAGGCGVLRAVFPGASQHADGQRYRCHSSSVGLVDHVVQPTQRARLQIAEVGHRADIRFASITKQIEDLTELVKGLGHDNRGNGAEARAGGTGQLAAGSTRDGTQTGSVPQAGGQNAEATERDAAAPKRRIGQCVVRAPIRMFGGPRCTLACLSSFRSSPWFRRQR